MVSGFAGAPVDAQLDAQPCSQPLISYWGCTYTGGNDWACTQTHHPHTRTQNRQRQQQHTAPQPHDALSRRASRTNPQSKLHTRWKPPHPHPLHRHEPTGCAGPSTTVTQHNCQADDGTCAAAVYSNGNSFGHTAADCCCSCSSTTAPTRQTRKATSKNTSTTDSTLKTWPPRLSTTWVLGHGSQAAGQALGHTQ